MPDQPAAAIVSQVRAALESDDPTRFQALLHPDVRWGAPGDPSPSCQNRDQVLTWYQRSRDAGMRARVTGADVHGDKILIALRVTGRSAAEPTGGEVERWQVLTVRDGQIADIRAFEQRDEAVEMASTSDPR
jgi:ketosteroid isomerase-like protein